MLRSFLFNSTALRAPSDRPGFTPAGDDDDLLDELPDDGAEEDELLADEAADDDADDAVDAPVDDAGAADDPGDDAGQQPPRRQQPRSRAAERIQRLKSEKDDLERRLQAMEQRQQPVQPPFTPQQPQISESQERERLALMTPEERSEYRVNKALQISQQQTEGMMRGMRDQADRTDFNQVLLTTPKLKRYESEVEQHYQRVLREGGYVARRAVLTYIIGERTLQRIAKAEPARKQSPAQQRVQRQNVRPGSTRNDVAAPRRSGGNRSLEARLENVPI